MGTELVQPIGKVTRRSAPNGVWKVVRSRDDSAKDLSSYPTNKSRIPPQALPAKCAANSSVAGGRPECAIVTAFNGSRLCTSHKLFPSFFNTQNHLERYDELEGSYTPAPILVLIILHTSWYIGAGIGIFLSTQGVCGTTGMSTGRKKSSWKCPHSESSQASPSFCSIIKWCINLCSSAHKKSSPCISSILSFHSRGYLPVGSKSSG